VTLDEMSHPDREAKLRRAANELDARGRIELETFLKKNQKKRKVAC
jgi:hypothetical protein